MGCLQNQIFKSQYLHILSPLTHFPFTPNPLHFSLSNHCSSALAKGNATSTQANPWNTLLSSSHSTVQQHSAQLTISSFFKPSSLLIDTTDSRFSSYPAGYSFSVSFLDPSSFARYPNVVSSKARNSFLCPFSLSELIHTLAFKSTNMHMTVKFIPPALTFPPIFRLVIAICLFHISTQMSNGHPKFNRSRVFYFSPQICSSLALLFSVNGITIHPVCISQRSRSDL